MRILFIGYTEGSKQYVQTLLAAGAKISAVITLDPEFTVIKNLASFDEIKKQYDIPIHFIRNVNSLESKSLIMDYHPDYLFVFGWSQLLKLDVLSIAKYGTLGLHPAPLPLYRGRHPVIWSLALGFTKSAVTILFLNEGVDSGDIIDQRYFTLDWEDDANSILNKVRELTNEMLIELVPLLMHGKVDGRPQDHRQATYLRKRSKEDGWINWNDSTEKIYNLIRSLSYPYIGSSTFLNGSELIIWKTNPPNRNSFKVKGTPGRIIKHTNNSFCVNTKDGFIEILEWEWKTNNKESIPSIDLIFDEILLSRPRLPAVYK